MNAQHQKRQGFAVAEMIAGLVVISAVAVATALAAAQILTLRQAVFRRTLARETAANVLQQIDGWSFAETPQRAQELSLPPQLLADLPSAQLTVDVSDDESPMPLLQVAAEITWGRGSHRVRAVTWKVADQTTNDAD